MTKTKTLLLGTATGFAMFATAASASSFSILDAGMGAVGPNATLPAGFSLSSIYGAQSPNIGDSITTFASNPTNGGLYLNGKGSMNFTFLGKEAGAKNASVTTGGATITNHNGIGKSMGALQTGAGFINFMFQTIEGAWEDINGNGTKGETLSIANNGISGFSGLSMAYGAVFNNGKSVLAFFGDGRGDVDYDDMVVRIDLVPLPAAGLMMLGALGGLGALRRRKKTA